MSVLLERDSLLSALGSYLDEALGGRGRLVFLGGEAGAGKTALVTRFAADVGERVRVLRGACDGGTTMPLFLDVHSVHGEVSMDDVAKAHAADLQVQGAHGVRNLKYWVDEANGKIFCLVDAPDAETAATVHREAHGLMADEIFEVLEGS